jgi:hypothetical protein
VKKAETIMEILATNNLTHSQSSRCRRTGRPRAEHGGALCTCARWRRFERQARPAGPIDRSFREHIERWVDESHGRVRADVARDRLEALGYSGSERRSSMCQRMR